MPERRPATVRRQARGERRIAQVVSAAAEVLAEVGYESATTNAIATRAGISPGSLYQFFGSKDEIVSALVEHYRTELAAVHDGAFGVEELSGLGLDELVERVLDPVIRFNREHRAFKALFARTDMPAPLAEATAPLQDAVLGRVSALLAVRAPKMAADELLRVSTVAVQVVRGLMPLVIAEGEREDGYYRGELQRVLVGYLADRLAVD